MTTMNFGKRDLDIVRRALNDAIDWQSSLAEANNHIPVERKKCEKRIAGYKKMQATVLAALGLVTVDPLAGAKLVTLDELRETQDPRESSQK